MVYSHTHILCSGKLWLCAMTSLSTCYRMAPNFRGLKTFLILPDFHDSLAFRDFEVSSAVLEAAVKKIS